MEIIFRRDPTIYDGRFANNGWLQEVAEADDSDRWDNPVLMSVATAKKLKLKSEDVVELELNGRKVRGAIWLTPGHPDDAVTVSPGLRARTLRAASALASASTLTSCAPRTRCGLPTACKLRATGEHYRAGLHAGASVDGRPRDCARGDAGGLHQEPRLCARDGRGSRAGADALQALRLQRKTSGAWRST